MQAGTPVARWQAADADTLLRQYLPAATSELGAYSNGLLVGLLPYPRNARIPHEPGHEGTPAQLMLFDTYSTPQTLPDIPAQPFRLTCGFTPDTSRARYLADVRRVQEYLAAGDAYQVNLAQRFTAHYEGSPWRAFARVAAAFQPPHAAWLDLGDRALMSFSPESFLALNDAIVETRPIKGTRPRGSNATDDRMLADDLARHPKDRAENLMIVDLLRNDLGQVCVPGTVRVPQLFAIESFRNVHHLVSTVTGQLAPGRSIGDLLLACFPGGSITGAPKRRAMEIIDELEPVPRDVYCGSLFWLTADGRFGSNILIRTFLAQTGVIHGWAGAGIVADSSPEAEYQECLDKLQSLMGSLEH